MGFIELGKTFFRLLTDFVYPPFCLLCDVNLDRDAHLICESCWQGLPRVEIPGDDALPDAIPLLSVWRYEEGFQKIAHEMKFFGKSSLARRMAQEMAGLLLQNSDFATADYLVPVPLHKTRMRERGFNQSALLSRAISKMTDIPVNNELKRFRPTRFQSTLNAEQRSQNVNDAFMCKASHKIGHRRVILIDDVATTGSTLRACSQALRKAGAKQILALTAARTI